MLKKVIILLSSIIFTTVALAEHDHQGPEWKYKPIQCSTSKQVLQVLQEMGSKPLVGGLSLITDGTNNAITPMVMYYNMETNDFQIVEFHNKNSACIVTAGGDISFDTKKLEENLEKHLNK